MAIILIVPVVTEPATNLTWPRPWSFSTKKLRLPFCLIIALVAALLPPLATGIYADVAIVPGINSTAVVDTVMAAFAPVSWNEITLPTRLELALLFERVTVFVPALIVVT